MMNQTGQRRLARLAIRYCAVQHQYPICRPCPSTRITKMDTRQVNRRKIVKNQLIITSPQRREQETTRQAGKTPIELKTDTQFMGNGSAKIGIGCRIQPFRTTPCRVPSITTQELRGRYGQFHEIGDKVGIIWNIWGKVAINWVKQIWLLTLRGLICYFSPSCQTLPKAHGRGNFFVSGT